MCCQEAIHGSIFAPCTAETLQFIGVYRYSSAMTPIVLIVRIPKFWNWQACTYESFWCSYVTFSAVTSHFLHLRHFSRSYPTFSIVWLFLTQLRHFCHSYFSFSSNWPLLTQLRHFWLQLRHFWSQLGHFWPKLRYFWSQLRHFWQQLGLFWPQLRHLQPWEYHEETNREYFLAKNHAFKRVSGFLLNWHNFKGDLQW